MFKYEGSAYFRQRIVCATLQGRSIHISQIRQEEQNQGMQDYEANFLRLMEKFTDGCAVEINTKGTSIKYTPGIMMGGSFTHDCGTSRSIGYHLEALLGMVPFAKKPVEITLLGITNDNQDICVDTLSSTAVDLLKQFEIEDISIKINKRGAPPQGGGSVTLNCTPVKQLSPILIEKFGKVMQIRGVAYSTRVSPLIGNRLIEGARSVLGHYSADIFIVVDHSKGADSGLSPGFGLMLNAATTTGCTVSTEKMGGAGSVPEDIGKEAAQMLLEEVMQKGCVDTALQSLALLYMTTCSQDVSKIRLGPLSDYTIGYVQNLREFFGVTFRIKPDSNTKTLLFTCLGTGYKNLAKKVQ